MNKKTIASIAALLIVLGAAGLALARPTTANGGFWNGMMGGLNNGINGMMGTGMMGAGNGYGGMMGSGMMGSGNGYGGMMGSGMMGGGNGYGGMMSQFAGNGTAGGCGGTTGVSGNATPITIEEAKGSVEKYLAKTGNTDLEIAEVIEFDNHFYAGIKEKSTGKYALELLVNRYTGSVFPEMGPNMMWNTKYGHMSWNTQGASTVTEKQAVEKAQEYLDTALPGTKVDEADAFYGYYTLEVKKGGNIYGMLSVNADTGAVWYHTWHGTFVKILEVE